MSYTGGIFGYTKTEEYKSWPLWVKAIAHVYLPSCYIGEYVKGFVVGTIRGLKKRRGAH